MLSVPLLAQYKDDQAMPWHCAACVTTRGPLTIQRPRMNIKLLFICNVGLYRWLHNLPNRELNVLAKVSAPELRSPSLAR